jgi:hypothetical protein
MQMETYLFSEPKLLENEPGLFDHLVHALRERLPLSSPPNEMTKISVETILTDDCVVRIETFYALSDYSEKTVLYYEIEIQEAVKDSSFGKTISDRTTNYILDCDSRTATRRLTDEFIYDDDENDIDLPARTEPLEYGQSMTTINFAELMLVLEQIPSFPK